MMSLYPDWNKVRRRPVGHIINELKDALDRIQGIRSVDLVDDDFGSAPIEYIETFRDQYRKHIDLPLDVMGMRPIDIVTDKLDILKDVGVTKLRMGIQSVTKEGKKLFNRRYSNDFLMEKVNLLHTYRKDFHTIRYDFIIDTPWDQPNATIETLKFISKMPTPFSINVFALALYPGTSLYQRAIDEKIIDESDVWEGRLNKNFMELRPTWCNFLMVCMGIFHLSPPILNFLIHPFFTKRIGRVPKILFNLTFMLSMAKRFCMMVLHGDYAQFKKAFLYLHEYNLFFNVFRRKDIEIFPSEPPQKDNE